MIRFPSYLYIVLRVTLSRIIYAFNFESKIIAIKTFDTYKYCSVSGREQQRIYTGKYFIVLQKNACYRLQKKEK